MNALPASAVLFADVAGSSRLYKTLGDAKAQELVGMAVAAMAAAVEGNGGRVVKTIGDEVMGRFDEAVQAIEAAIGIQLHRQGARPRMEIRIGVHYGPTVEQGQDIFGEAVNDAAALVRIARGGQIITSGETVALLPAHLQTQALPFDRVRLKGSTETSVIYAVRWEPEAAVADSTQLMSAIAYESPPPESEAQIEIRCGDRYMVVRPHETPFVVGRDPAVAHLAIASGVASRDHLHIDYRRGKFVLSDNSTNGTWVQLAGGEPLYLRREELPLSGQGVISVGQVINGADPNLIHFSV